MPKTPTFLANLPSWQQSLLHQMTTEHSHREILEMLQASTKPPIIATDGSVKPYRAQGTFAWVLADQDGTPWLRCCRPVSGTQINSLYSEAHALLTVLVYLNLLADHFIAAFRRLWQNALRKCFLNPYSPANSRTLNHPLATWRHASVTRFWQWWYSALEDRRDGVLWSFFITFIPLWKSQ
jgi:hypothetical protein